MKLLQSLLALSLFLCGPSAILADDESPFHFAQSPGEVRIFHGDQPLLSYFYNDKTTTRPYFAHVKTLEGTQVTRNFPPQEGDPQDHPHFHPGICLAFGDISGNDYWRLKAKVKHVDFIEPPDDSTASFTVENHYLSSTDESTVCIERCRYQLREQPAGYLLQIQSEFSSPDGSFYFGDQEEMGLAVRVATPIREDGGNGRILNSYGKETAKLTWGQQAQWVDYSGTIDEHQVGVLVMCDPDNHRPSWWHNRGYGLFVANMFGQNAMKQGPKSKIVVEENEIFRLGYGVYIHEADQLTRDDLQDVYSRYLDLEKDEVK